MTPAEPASEIYIAIRTRIFFMKSKRDISTLEL